jgi:hypothetical protein
MEVVRAEPDRRSVGCLQRNDTKVRVCLFPCGTDRAWRSVRCMTADLQNMANSVLTHTESECASRSSRQCQAFADLHSHAWPRAG